ncbi:MAG: hypothetical protein J1G38_03270 [Clostridiales bacterium]|nr:hypothetical protein [Clostridiales bacterium]
MEQLISLVVANGLWAALFCILLAFEIRDSRRRESKYTATISSLSERLGTVNAVKSDTAEIKADAKTIMSDTAAIRKTGVKKRGEVGAV